MPPEDEAPKSAFELAMERLRKKDREAGVEEVAPVSDEHKAAIAEVRRVHEARLAEREILHAAELRKAQDQETFDKLELEYRRDRERIADERERKIEGIRKG
jgi:hypothetical protein